MYSIQLRKASSSLAFASLLGVGAALLAPAPAHADTINVTVSANIIGICKFVTGQTPTITIANTGANIDPSLAGPATGNVNINYQCTNGQAPTFTVPTPATITCTTPGTCFATTMAPAMSSTPGGSGAGFSGGVKVLNVAGQLTAAQYANMQVGTYSGTETVTVTP